MIFQLLKAWKKTLSEIKFLNSFHKNVYLNANVHLISFGIKIYAHSILQNSYSIEHKILLLKWKNGSVNKLNDN